MKFTLQYPIARARYSPALLAADGIRKVVMAAEAAGFGSIAFTEHPAPSQKWMAGGGHESFDPLTALALCAGVTSTILLQTYLLVLPYRNPFLAAKQAATLDLISGGRLVMSVGSGYLRSEFLALGVEFEERNALFDEALEVMRRSWSEDDVAYEGLHFKALGQTQRPRPAELGPAIGSEATGRWPGNGPLGMDRAGRPCSSHPKWQRRRGRRRCEHRTISPWRWRTCTNLLQLKDATGVSSTSRSNGERAPPLPRTPITSSNWSQSSPMPGRPGWWSIHLVMISRGLSS